MMTIQSLPKLTRNERARTLGTAAWNTKSVIGKASEFVAVTIIDTTFDGLPGAFSNAKSIFKPLL